MSTTSTTASPQGQRRQPDEAAAGGWSSPRCCCSWLARRGLRLERLQLRPAEGRAFKLTKPEATLPFEVAIGMIFIGTYLGGRIQDRRGPRTVAIIGGVIYGVGVIVASFARSGDQLRAARDRLRRAGRLRPRARLHRADRHAAEVVPRPPRPDHRSRGRRLRLRRRGHRPDRAGPDQAATRTSRPRPSCRSASPTSIAAVVGAFFFRNPPDGYTVPGYVPATSGKVVDSGRDYTQGEALRTWQWYTLTAILTLAVLAGIAFISQAAASFADVAGYTAAAAAAAVGFLGLFNGAGRIFWAAISGRLGRMVDLHPDPGHRGCLHPADPARAQRGAVLRPGRARLPLLRRRLRHDARHGR